MTAKKTDTAPDPAKAFEAPTDAAEPAVTVEQLTAQVAALTSLLSQRGMISQGTPGDVVAAHQAQIQTNREPVITDTIAGNRKKVNYA